MHRWSKLFIPTLREAPADAEVASHKFLIRSGYIRQLGAGIYSYLFLGQRSINRIIAIVREEMDRIGQEFFLPAIHPADLWRESGRWTIMGDAMFRLKDRKGADLCLGMTHEEVMTDIARNELHSYKQLPQTWYQIQTKFRDEPRPRSGLLRVRQFIMKDSYSFDLDEAGLDRSYKLHDGAYRAIFTRSGLNFVVVEADSGAMGGSQSQEFMVYSDAGEDLIASCAACGYAANLEKATSRLAPVKEMEPTGDGKPELVSTPGQAAIADVAKFFSIEPSSDIKCVAYMARYLTWPQPVVVLLRGDHEVNETKLLSMLGALDLRFMTSEELSKYLGGPAGYLGPIGLNAVPPLDQRPLSEEVLQRAKDAKTGEVTVILDHGLENRRNLVCGANKLDYHYRNVVPGRDFQPTLVADIRNVLDGEGCPATAPSAQGPNPRLVFPWEPDGTCTGTLHVAKAVEVGHIFKLGRRYTDSMGCRVLDSNGKEVTPIMGCYGIGIERILTAAIEQGNDANGFWLPRSIAPFDVVVTVTNVSDPALNATGEKIAAELEAAGFDVLLDDRDERAGVKFKDADLIGVPYRITVGRKAAEGKVELVTRATASGRDVAIADVAQELSNLARN
jgi:prolyl-tRNA synthetase